VKGEVTVVVAGAPRVASEPDLVEAARVATELAARGLSTKEIVRELTEFHGISRNEGYRLVTRLS
jgi:16S rRNA C1402 (ribose-2'-O) methylase RsmI